MTCNSLEFIHSIFNAITMNTFRGVFHFLEFFLWKYAPYTKLLVPEIKTKCIKKLFYHFHSRYNSTKGKCSALPWKLLGIVWSTEDETETRPWTRERQQMYCTAPERGLGRPVQRHCNLKHGCKWEKPWGGILEGVGNPFCWIKSIFQTGHRKSRGSEACPFEENKDYMAENGGERRVEWVGEATWQPC